MAGLTLAKALDEGTPMNGVIVSVEARSEPNAWTIRPTSGVPEPSPADELILRTGATEPRQSLAELWRMVAPGIMVRDSEYQARFSHLDLDSLRQRLTPEKFRAFVRHIGMFEGRSDVDMSLVREESR